MSKKQKTLLLSCPKCGDTRVLVSEETAFYVNTGEFFCTSVKTHDDDATVNCPSCWWQGQRQDLKEMETE